MEAARQNRIDPGFWVALIVITAFMVCLIKCS